MAPVSTMDFLSKKAHDSRHELSVIEKVFIFVLPFLAFVTSSLVVVLLYEWFPWTTMTFLVVLLVASMVFAWRGLTIPSRSHEFYIGSLAAIALVLGFLVGVIAYRWYFFPYYLNAQYNSFTHVLPSNPSEGYADAGKLIFVEEARVESQLSMGYKDGGLYCVAPVIDEATTSEVGFWAVGQDCCSSRGNFVCDDAWNTDARAAIVVRKDDTFFGGDTFEHYMKAVRQAEAAYEITASRNPVLVRWVLNPTEVQGNYQREGFGLLAVMWAIYFVISTIVVCVLHSMNNNKKSVIHGGSSRMPTSTRPEVTFPEHQNVASAAPLEPGLRGSGATMAPSAPLRTHDTWAMRTGTQGPGVTQAPSAPLRPHETWAMRTGATDPRRVN